MSSSGALDREQQQSTGRSPGAEGGGAGPEHGPGKLVRSELASDFAPAGGGGGAAGGAGPVASSGGGRGEAGGGGGFDDWAMSPGLSSAMGLDGGSGGAASGGGGAPVQRKAAPAPAWAGAQVQARGSLGGAGGGGEVADIAGRGVASASSPLPHQEAIQQSFGKHDLSGVRAQVGGEAAESAQAIGASAYATGNRVAFAQSPDLHTAAHEAAHVVQQAQGVNLYGGVGRAGDAHEQHADAVADAVVAGRSAEGLLDQYGKGAGGGSAAVQRQAREITPAQITAALAWVTSSNIGPETTREVQRVCGITQSGTYDEATVRAVYTKQQELHIGADGQAGQTFCQRTGLIFTNTIVNATVTDAILLDVSTRFPSGVTVAIYPNFNAGVSGRAEFQSQAGIFAANQHAVGLSGGAVVIGQPCQITESGDVIEVVQSIHRGLLAKWNESQRAAAASSGGAGMSPAEAPAYTKVLNLALFSHGESWGMGMNASNDFSGNGLHNNTTRGVNPSNIEAFARGLTDAVLPGVRVQLFACSTGADSTRSSYEEWTGHTQGERAGGSSMASSLATALGPDATVSAHTTVGHTTENYAARVFGAEAGAGAGGITLFDSMYPETYVQSELLRLFPDLDAAGRTARHDSLRELMWAHFKDSVLDEHNRAPSAKRYTVPMGQECFVNPGHARELLYADWQTWCTSRMSRVTAARAR